LRSIIYRFDDVAAFHRALGRDDLELVPPPSEHVADGEAILAIFEVGTGRRATAAAARAVDRGGDRVLVFERRDWERMRAITDPVPVAPLSSTQEVPILSENPPAEGPPESANVPATVPSPTAWLGSDTERPPPDVDSDPTLKGLKGVEAHVLLVDDDEEIREVVAAMLEAVGLAVDAVDSAEAALEKVASNAYDLAVLDWNLPGMSGLELCRRIRRRPEIATMPVLFLTAHDSSKDVVEAFAVGADDFVTKPFRAPELGARIFGLLRRARLGAPGSR